MKKSINLFKLGLILILVFLITSILSSILNLINIKTLIFGSILFIILSNKSFLVILNKLINKVNFSNNYTRSIGSVPKSRNEAVRKSLKSIETISAQIRNNVAAEGLLQEKTKVERELLRGDLVIVVFGPGSSGKTSLVRALLNNVVGRVEPNMGSTKSLNSYRLRLKRLERCIKIIDTPGISESGELGRMREKDSLLKASVADLILFVIDNDLREFEMEVISSLSKSGKRIFMVLNKCDLISEKEEQKLLYLINRRTKGLIYKADIISTVASPQSIPLRGRRPLQPKPEINQLIKRIATVLHEEGEELIADNILLQCKNLGESGKLLLSKQRLIESKRCIEKYVWITSGVVLVTPLPGIDILGTAVVNGRMVMDIAKTFGVQLDQVKAKELAMSVGQTIAGLGIVKGGVSLIGNSLSLQLPTFIIGKSIQSITAAWLTKIAGDSFISYFQQEQNWGDGGIQDVVQRHYNLNMRESNIKRFIDAAMSRVVEPLERGDTKQLPPHSRLRGVEGASEL